MKLEKLKIGATIPVQKYGNIIPEIEISSEDPGEDLMAVGMGVIKDLFLKYSEVGGLEEKDFVPSVVQVMKSYNEEGVLIEFEPVNHIYTYNDKKLVSATEYIKRFYKAFDVETISSVLESKWGVPQKVIKDLWEKNGEVTSEFGNLVDKTLGYYENLKSFGEIISSKQQVEENYCLPKHPILRKIVKEFYEMVKDGNGAKILTQVLLTNIKLGICGTADRIKIIDLEKKICRVQDYKVNIEAEKIDKSCKASEPFSELPANKITKYQLQMSIYANMLQASGWSVEGLDVFVYEDNWKHFELPVLKVV